MQRAHISLLVASFALASCEAQIDDGRLLCATSDVDSCPGDFMCCPAAITGGYDGLCYRAACPDAGMSLSDAGGEDAGPRDGGGTDAGSMDAGARDAGALDAGPLDGGPPPSLVQVTAGGLHSCALYSDSSAYCWGYNVGGQLGNGATRTDAGETEAVAVIGLPSGVSRLVAGLVHTCALHAGGVVCWGANNLRQIGDGSSALNQVAPTPVLLGATEPVVDLSAGDNHTCVVLSDATVMCWGANDQGQLGRAASGPQATPVLVNGIDEAVEVRAGAASTCVRRMDGSVWCWGRNNQGQLGRGTTSTREEVPAVVSGFDGASPPSATHIDVGGSHACAVLPTETRCWGAGLSGQLGNSMSMTSSTPVVVSLTGASPSMIGLGDSHSCVAGPAIDAQCWGAGPYGQIGNGRADFINYTNDPVPVTGLSMRPTDLAAGGEHVCAIVDGQALCWGRNNQGQLGNRTTTDSGTPVMVRGLP